MLQVKVLIGTIAFMLTMIILGFATLLEPARMQAYTLAAEARSVESGAHVYYSNCASCHGQNGAAKECYDSASGEQIACQGLPLNSRNLLCGEPSKRLTDWGWGGTKYGFVQMTVAVGRNGGIMPTWSQEFGGPLQQNEVDDVTRFVINWESEELCSVQPPTFPWTTNHPDAFEALLAVTELTPEAQQLYTDNDITLSLPLSYPGDAANGALLYESYACNTCHGNMDEPGSNQVGPWLGDLDANAASRIAGYSAEEYIYESIFNPGAFIAGNCPAGECANAMPANFGDRMSESPQDMTDIITLLMQP